ncbi:hypothetical protein T05_1346 [Trichinella murrelli]|uniref:Uncharacterized protein n=1 Tax=Trichinella murrelli TaxID=144512 RepID=A0A0V0S951_9BILA|nr:hypothetical protein T05_1346 [Trichinella murrelli]
MMNERWFNTNNLSTSLNLTMKHWNAFLSKR